MEQKRLFFRSSWIWNQTHKWLHSCRIPTLYHITTYLISLQTIHISNVWKVDLAVRFWTNFHGLVPVSSIQNRETMLNRASHRGSSRHYGQAGTSSDYLLDASYGMSPCPWAWSKSYTCAREESGAIFGGNCRGSHGDSHFGILGHVHLAQKASSSLLGA